MALINTDLGYHVAPYHAFSYHGTLSQGGMGSQILSLGVVLGGSQVIGTVSALTFGGAQIKTGNLGHSLCEGLGYHIQPYHSTPYHQARQCVGGAAQVRVLSLTGFGAQVRAAIYNTNNLRVLCDFASRGDGNNWTASSTEPSTTDSFSVLNVNTDITEQYWRSVTGVKTGIVLECDAGAGNTVFLDTLAFLNNNLTSSANIVLTGSANPAHAPSGDSFILTIDKTAAAQGDFVYIAPDLPSIGYRYWRINIDDGTNAGTFLQIGTIVFGESLIFNNECFVDRVRKIPKNFKDGVKTEAFTNINNDRGIKREVRLDFRNIKFDGGNFDRLVNNVFSEARTVLKCLWVPTPEFPLRFMTFAKLTQIPEESHNVKSETKDYVDFTIVTDESL